MPMLSVAVCTYTAFSVTKRPSPHHPPVAVHTSVAFDLPRVPWKRPRPPPLQHRSSKNAAVPHSVAMAQLCQSSLCVAGLPRQRETNKQKAA